MKNKFNWHIDRIAGIQEMLTDAQKECDKQAFTVPTKEATDRIILLCGCAVIELNKLIKELQGIKNTEQYTTNK